MNGLLPIEAALVEVDGLPEGPETEQVRAALLVELAQAALDDLDLPRTEAALVSAGRAALLAEDEALRLDVAAVSGMLEALSGQADHGLDRIARRPLRLAAEALRMPV